MANLQGGGQVALKRLRGLTVDQLAEQIVAVPGQLAIILLHGINAQGKRIIQIVIVEAGEMNIGIQQMMLAHIAQHPFEQPAGRGEERLRRTPQPSAERREHLIAGAGVVVAVDHPLRAQRDPRLGQALGEPRQPVARRRQPRLAAEKPELVRMLRRDTGDQPAVGVTESVITSGRALSLGERSNSTTGSCSLSF